MNSLNKPVVLFPMRLQMMKLEGERQVPVYKRKPIVIDDLIKLSEKYKSKPRVIGRKGGITKAPARRFKPVNLQSPKAIELIKGGFIKKEDLMKIDLDIFDYIEFETQKYNYYKIRWYPDACQAFNPVRPLSDKEEDAYGIYLERSSNANEETSRMALSDFINAVGTVRARHIILAKEKGIDPSDPADDGIAGKSFFKLLPGCVKIYTAKNLSVINAQPFEIKELSVPINPIPEDLCISMEELSPDRKSWINDFSKAEQVGMAVSVTESVHVSQVDSADWLLVVGFSGDDNCDELIGELFMRKRASGAFEVIRQDSPTNNSEDEKSAYSGGKMKTDGFKEIFKENSSGLSSGLSAENILGAVFGFDEAKKKQAFGYIKNGNTLEQAYAIDAFTLMYPGCTGEFWKAKLESKRYIQMPIVEATAGGQIHIHYETVPNPAFNSVAATLHNSEFTIFDDLKCYVSARGTVPPVLIDKNPYGILPVRSLQFWNFDNLNDPGALTYSLKNLSEMINKKRFEDRYSGITKRYNSLQSIADRMEVNIKKLPVPDNVYIRNLYYEEQSFSSQEAVKMEMPIVQEGDLSSLCQIIHEAHTYMGSLHSGNTTASLPQIFTEAPLTANSLLVAIVKKSLLRMKELYSFDDSKQKAIDMLNRMKTAIDFLNSVRGPSLKEMEVLVKETVDIFSPRYDAWVLALSARRLLTTDRAAETVERNNEKSNMPDVPCPNQNLTGVFGWLENPGNAPSTRKTDGYFQTPSANQTVAAAMIRNASLYNEGEGNPFQVNLSSQRLKKAIWFVEGLKKGYSWAELLGMRLERLLHDQNLDRLLYSLRSHYPLDQARDTLKCSHLINGEAFLQDDDLAGKGFLDDDINALNLLKVSLRELSDSVSDVFVSEIAYNLAAGNADMANAWLSAFENKLIPPKIRMAATARTGQVLLQRVVLPMDGSEAGSTERNPRHIAEPSLTRLAETILSALGYNSGAGFAANVHLRENESGGKGKLLKTVIINPITDLGMSAYDIVLGGRKELEAFARRFVLRVLHREYKNLDGALKEVNPEEAFESKAYIVFDYSAGMDAVLEKASELLTVIKSSQPMGYDDIAAAHASKQEQYSIRVDGLKTLYARLYRLSTGYRAALNKFIELKTELKEVLTPAVKPVRPIKPVLEQARIDSCISQINTLLDTFVRFGFREANVYLYAEPVSTINGKSKAPIIEKLESIIDRLGRREVEQITGDILKYQLNDEAAISYDIDTDCFISSTGEVVNESFRMLALNAMLEKVTKQLQEWTSKDTMVVLPPFKCRDALNVAGAASKEQLKLYGSVRKNIASILSLTGRFAAGITNSVWEPGILESIEAVKSRLTKNLNSADAIAALNDLKDLKLKGRPFTDVHYLLTGSSFTLTTGTPVAGLKIDEWPDFIHNNSEVTGVGFKCQTPKSQAPNVILIAVPEYQYPINYTGEWTHQILVRHLAETLRLMFIRTEGFTYDGPMTAEPDDQDNENAVFIDNVAPVMYFKSKESDPLLR